MNDALLTISGSVEREMSLTFGDLVAMDASQQIADVSTIEPKRQGGAVRLAGLLALAGVKADAAYLGLHASKDDFHASVPLDAVRERAIVIYRMGDEPLPETAGGPVRLFIPDFAACHTAEVDECTNVKFVDRIELTRGKGFDNRPSNDKDHDAIHQRDGE